MLYDIIDSAQERLDYSCCRWQLLWIHMVAFTFGQMLVSMLHLRRSIAFDDLGEVLRTCTDIFHGMFGAAALLSVLIAPAMVTQRFKDAPATILNGFCRRRDSLEAAKSAVPLFSLKAAGFRVLGEPISTATVGRFLTLIGVCTSALLTM